jgi:hypothetical protein
MFLGGHVFEQINMKKKTFLEHMCNKKLTQMCVDIHKHLIESCVMMVRHSSILL